MTAFWFLVPDITLRKWAIWTLLSQTSFFLLGQSCPWDWFEQLERSYSPVPVRPLPLKYLRLYSRGAPFYFVRRPFLALCHAWLLSLSYFCKNKFLAFFFLSFVNAFSYHLSALIFFLSSFSYPNDDWTATPVSATSLFQALFDDIESLGIVREINSPVILSALQLEWICWPTRKVVLGFLPTESQILPY